MRNMQKGQKVRTLFNLYSDLEAATSISRGDAGDAGKSTVTGTSTQRKGFESHEESM
jgi:hypothetical protein